MLFHYVALSPFLIAIEHRDVKDLLLANADDEDIYELLCCIHDLNSITVLLQEKNGRPSSLKVIFWWNENVSKSQQ